MKPAEKWKVDLQFRRLQSFTVRAKKLEAVVQTGMPIFLDAHIDEGVAVEPDWDLATQPAIQTRCGTALRPVQAAHRKSFSWAEHLAVDLACRGK